MFRNIFHIILTLFLIISISGFSISKHYCGHQLVSVKINQEAKACCDDTGGCCHNQTDFFQLDEDFEVLPVLENELIKTATLFAFYYIIVDHLFDLNGTTDVLITDSPPPKDLQMVLSGLQSYLC